MSLNIEGSVRGVYYVPTAGETIESVALEAAQVTLEGFPGDRHAGMTMRSDSRTSFYARGTTIRNGRQVSIVSVEELAQAAHSMGIDEIRPEWLGANLAFAGIPHLTQLPPGTRLFFPGEVVLIVQAENGPCLTAGRAIQSHFPDRPGLDARFPVQALHLRGVVACVERPGTIRPGEGVRALVPDQVLYPGN